MRFKTFARRALSTVLGTKAVRFWGMQRRNALAVDSNRMLLGQMHAHRVAGLSDFSSLRQAEFSVYSQWGEDGIIEYIVSRIDAPREVFVEFGVQDYTESNTRFLLKNRYWSGHIFDGSKEHIDFIRKDEIHWRYDLTAAHAFITAENINQLLTANGVTGEVGLLSIDIDGNDYWVWKAITVIDPKVVICEFNSVFGATHSITVPYRSDFSREKAHFSHLYFGASLPALCQLAAEKGYAFVGSCKAGTNAFFVRRDCMQRFTEVTPDQGYVLSGFRESRAPDGRFTFLSGKDRLRMIGDCKVYDLDSAAIVHIRDLDLISEAG